MTTSSKASRPRLGFLGVGWIGRHRMEAIIASGAADVVAIADPNQDAARAARAVAPRSRIVRGLEEMLEQPIDGLVIATPSAVHAEQTIAALQRGIAVFCQKPLGRCGKETARVVEAARLADRLLGVDFSYRFTRAMQIVRPLVASGELGDVYAANLVFHNAYGPDKAWFYDPKQSGGGCVVDLGIHLVDLALWALDFPRVQGVSSRMFAAGRPVNAGDDVVEDYAAAQLTLDGGRVVQIACSWKLPAGCDAVIEATFFGTQGGVSLRNTNGSFYDFVVERYSGTSRERLCEPPDAWGGRAAVDWAMRLARGERFDAEIERAVTVADTLDRIRSAGAAG